MQNLTALNDALQHQQQFLTSSDIPCKCGTRQQKILEIDCRTAKVFGFSANCCFAVFLFCGFASHLGHTCKRSFASTDLLCQHLQMQNPFPLSRFEEKKHFSTNQQRILRPWLMGLVMEITLSLLLPMLYKDSKVCRFNLSSRQ